MKFSFAEWLKQEMTSVSSVSGTSAGDIAHFSRPLFSGDLIGRQWANTICDDDEDNKKKKRKKDQR